MGLGHMVRSLALAEMLPDLFKIHFITRNPLVSLEKEIKETCESMIVLPEDLTNENEAAYLVSNHVKSGDVVVLDGYHFSTGYQSTLKNSGCLLVCIDDIHSYHFVADIVINHAPGLSPSVYSKEPYTRLYLGPKYSLVRSCFLDIAKRRRYISSTDTIFICFGGSDYHDLTLRSTLDLISDNQIKMIHIVLGDAYMHEDIFRLKKEVDTRLTIHKSLNQNQLMAIMLNCHVAIAPASTICYELCTVKMPIICGYYVENQKEIYRGFLKENLIMGIGDLLNLQDGSYQEALKRIRTDYVLQDFIDIQAKFFDGEIRNRLIQLFRELC
jgi:UDP-2,4-diacetamido-2,4,6-trideoxy-beta-L-altropyranose hydrolase